MYCFANNIDFGFDWQLAYNQLATHFTQLSTDYQKAIDLGEVLALKVSRITKENEEIRTAKITNMFQSTTAALPPSVAVLPQREEEITMRNLPKPAPRIKKMTSMETSEPSVFECTYQCGKIYKSTVSMNLHIKVKHNGGTKKEREEYAVLENLFRRLFSRLRRGERVRRSRPSASRLTS